MADPASPAAPLLAAQGIVRSAAHRPLLEDVSLSIAEGERAGLVGANGSGKTTLLRVLAGLESPEEGRVSRRRGVEVGFLPQEAEVEPDRTVAEVLAAGQAPAKARAAALEELDERHAAEERLERELATIADALGLPAGDRLCGTLSGGERRRVALARVLLARPDLLLLDEPTNHLDAETLDWLEDHLASSRAAALIVTHDRFFLDRVTSRILEIDRGRIHSYEGGYRRFLEEKAEREEREAADETARRAYLRAELLWLKSGVKAQRRKGKERVERVHELKKEVGLKPAVADELAFRLPGGPRLGQKVLELEGVAKRVGGRTLFEGLDLRLAAGDRLGVVGRNGAGKTTLLRLLMGVERPDAGSVVVGPTTRFSLVDQARAVLSPDKTIHAEVAGESDFVIVGGERLSVRAYLTRFLFSGDRQQALVRDLSGGERNRVALAKLLKAGGNVVLLDEPTNDLDLATLRVLEDALVAFEGAAVVVSHDRYFLERVATRTLGLEGGGRWRLIEGGYEAYREARASAAGTDAPAASTLPKPAAKRPAQTLTSAEKRELGGMERAIEAAEADVARISRAMEDSGLYGDPARRDEARRLARDLEAARAKVAALFARWEELEKRKSG